MTTTATVWRSALILGNLAGCLPSPSIDYLARSLEQYDGVEIDEENWPYFLWPFIRQVDDSYAACLERALANLDQTLTRIEATEGAKSAAFRELSRLDHAQKVEIQTLREWIGGRGFNVGADGGERTLEVLNPP